MSAVKGVRVWAAVQVDGRVVCSITDYDKGQEIPKSSADYRRFRWAVWEHGEPPQTDGHSRGGCFAAAPCDKCQKSAAKWWVEWQKRTDERWFVPAHHGAKTKSDAMAAGGGVSWAAADWGEQQKTLPKGFEAARAGGFPWVVERDGHGHIFRWIVVADGPPPVIIPASKGRQMGLFQPVRE